MFANRIPRFDLKDDQCLERGYLMHFCSKLHFRNWKGPFDSGKNLWRTSYFGKLEGDEIWKNGHV